MRIFSASGSIPAARYRRACTGAIARRRVGDACRIEVDGRSAVGVLGALALRDLFDDRLRDDVARAEGVSELLAVGVQEHGAVCARSPSGML